ARFRWSRADVRGGRAPMRKAETLVLHERHAEMRLVLVRGEARRDRVEPRREPAQDLGELLRLELGRMLGDQVDHLAGDEIALELRSVVEQPLELRISALLRVGGDRRLAELRDLEARCERFAERQRLAAEIDRR